jgi:aspartate/tyrosine/aromatic aminotransferase
VEELKKAGSTRDWSFVIKQIGMFSFTVNILAMLLKLKGLTKIQIQRLMDEFHIYMLFTGRISVAGLNSKNIAYVAQAFHEVTKEEV